MMAPMPTKRDDAKRGMKTTLYIDAELYTQLRIAAIEEGMAVTRLLEKLARDYVEKRTKSRK